MYPHGLVLLLKTPQRLPMVFKNQIRNSSTCLQLPQPHFSPTSLHYHTPMVMNFLGYSSPPSFCFFGPCCPHTLSPPGSSITPGSLSGFVNSHPFPTYTHWVLACDPDHSLITVVTPLFIYLQDHLFRKTRVRWGKGLGFIHLCILSTNTDVCFTLLMPFLHWGNGKNITYLKGQN